MNERIEIHNFGNLTEMTVIYPYNIYPVQYADSEYPDWTIRDCQIHFVWDNYESQFKIREWNSLTCNVQLAEGFKPAFVDLSDLQRHYINEIMSGYHCDMISFMDDLYRLLREWEDLFSQVE